MTFHQFINSKFATLILSVVLIFVMILTSRIIVQKRVIDKEVAKLQSQMDRIQKDNEQLSSLIQYLNTPEYKEKEAREKLNLAKEGEHIVVLPQSNVAADEVNPEPVKVSNLKLWFNYFFE